MSETNKKRALGRGLSSLLGEDTYTGSTETGPARRSLPIDLVRANPNQPRKTFKPNEMDDLIASIREKGVIQPLLVRPDPDREDGFQIVAGERRWRAAQKVGLHEIPVVIRELTDEDAYEIAIIENVQRADLNPLEEASAYSELIERHGHSQAGLARAIGKSRPHIANMLRLLTLPEEVRTMLGEGRLSVGHARALITSTDPASLAHKVIADGLTVRQTEDLARRVPAPTSTKRRRAVKDADTVSLENDLSAALGLKVAIDHRSEKGGNLKISYGSLEDLDAICRLLMR
ncbi:ParB/RepB/Spo0J family partition protein [Pikeienuella piscinae]|uniref:ParB/RepB/Spo0J family partition protein n=1 Tax=Pikeienuella piscinae TaxID=2748098 RepID=UPI001FE4F57A|nr:ParB/RepB/Spo0J family partition protein [Pikeienuella piscinae]